MHSAVKKRKPGFFLKHFWLKHPCIHSLFRSRFLPLPWQRVSPKRPSLLSCPLSVSLYYWLPTKQRWVMSFTDLSVLTSWCPLRYRIMKIWALASPSPLSHWTGRSDTTKDTQMNKAELEAGKGGRHSHASFSFLYVRLVHTSFGAHTYLHRGSLLTGYFLLCSVTKHLEGGYSCTVKRKPVVYGLKQSGITWTLTLCGKTCR